MRRSGEARLAWRLLAPALAVVGLVAVFPLGWTVWESFHRHDLRLPWLGRPFVGLANYAELARDARCLGALVNTVTFAIISIALELVLGTALALGLDRAFRGRGVVRAAVLLPWALPTVVAALLWRFMFETDAGIVNAALAPLAPGERPIAWLAGSVTAWVPVILADVWKTTPFVALLLLAGLQGIDPALHEAAAVDGASPWWRFRHITLPLLRPALVVTLVFRTLDAFRVFDLVYALTGGGPGTATEPVSLYIFATLLQHLRFGYGAAMSVVVFLVTFALALLYLRGLGLGEES